MPTNNKWCDYLSHHRYIFCTQFLICTYTLFCTSRSFCECQNVCFSTIRHESLQSLILDNCGNNNAASVQWNVTMSFPLMVKNVNCPTLSVIYCDHVFLIIYITSQKLEFLFQELCSWLFEGGGSTVIDFTEIRM